jgi:hypothetical protein
MVEKITLRGALQIVLFIKSYYIVQIKETDLGGVCSTHMVETWAKLKGKFVPVLKLVPCHEGVLGSGGIAPRILDLGTRWM